MTTMISALLALSITGIQTSPIQPKRVVGLESFTVKCTQVTSGSSASVSVIGGGGGASGTATTPSSIQIADPEGFASGLGEMILSSMSEQKSWLVVSTPVAGSDSDPEPEQPTVMRPEYLIRATIVEMTVSGSGGGINIGSLGGGQNQIRNRVKLDVKLIDASTRLVIETVAAQGSKSTKENLLGFYGKNSTKLFGWQEFKESPLGGAAELAVQDAVKKLTEKLAKKPWSAEIVAVEREEDSDLLYLNLTKDAGISEGAELEVYIPGEPIKDEKTGRVIGETKAKVLGRARVVERDTDLVTLQPLGEFRAKAGMRVRQPSKK
ncbi:MAG: hypothetical protein LCH41_03485 [Armatimonadetes bacterium]|nr:hypothetical protein [Armatimonadota bacterium]